MEYKGPPFLPRPFNKAADEAWEREQAQLSLGNRHAEKVLSQAACDLAQQLSLNPYKVRGKLNQLFNDYRQERQLTDTERAAEAKASLQDVAACAEALSAALGALGPGARAVMFRRSVDINTYLEAESWSLLKEADIGGLPHREEVETIPFPFPDLMGEKDREWEEERRRGGRWVIRLKALANLARRKARQIEIGAKKPGPKRLGAILYGSPDEWLINECLHFIRQHRGPEPLARAMAQAVKEAETKVKPTRGAGRKALKRVSRSPLK